MINVTLERLTRDNQADFNRCDNSFVVEAEVHLQSFSASTVTSRRHAIGSAVRPVTPYLKRYDLEHYDPDEYIGRQDAAAWLAYVEGELAGQILVRENWNRFAIVQDIAVNPAFRRQGVGGRLMEQAIAWARERNLPGVMLETQNINVPACCFYERCGFVLGGFDRYLYQGSIPGTAEIALFWYLLF